MKSAGEGRNRTIAPAGGEISATPRFCTELTPTVPNCCQFLVNRKLGHILFPAVFSFLQRLNLSSGWVGERRRLEILLRVTSLITEKSRVMASNSFDVTAECDATVIRDVIVLQGMLPTFLPRLEGF